MLVKNKIYSNSSISIAFKNYTMTRIEGKLCVHECQINIICWPTRFNTTNSPAWESRIMYMQNKQAFCLLAWVNAIDFICMERIPDYRSTKQIGKLFNGIMKTHVNLPKDRMNLVIWLFVVILFSNNDDDLIRKIGN